MEQLLTAGRRVRVLTRDAARAEHWRDRGADIAVADLAEPDTLAAANAGISQVVLQLPVQYDFDLHETYGRNAVDAAQAAGVNLLVFNTSAPVIAKTQLPAYQARQVVIDYLHASGVPSIVFRPTFYLEMLLGPGSDQRSSTTGSWRFRCRQRSRCRGSVPRKRPATRSPPWTDPT